ncbi:TPA: phosphohydrolase [Patescibacteria group bacterium]|nr:phosphohydrolase [Patescibacteria group bacterium]
MADNELKKITELFFEIGSLRRLQRSHIQNLGKTEDSVLDHSYRAAMMGYVIAKMEGLDADKVLKMCLWHDLAESRTGDRNWVHKKFVKVDETKASRAQFSGTPIAKEVLTLLKEFEARKTPESKLAKDVDYLEEVFQLKEYADQGNKEAERWLRSPYNIGAIKNKTAKQIISMMLKSDVHDWWWRKW